MLCSGTISLLINKYLCMHSMGFKNHVNLDGVFIAVSDVQRICAVTAFGRMLP